jgi:hypothetical protein
LHCGLGKTNKLDEIGSSRLKPFLPHLMVFLDAFPLTFTTVILSSAETAFYPVVITFADLLVYGGCFWVFPPSSAMANPPDQQNILQEIAKAFAQDTGQQINASAAPASECAHSFPLFRLQQFFVFILTSYPCKSVHISMFGHNQRSLQNWFCCSAGV